MVHGVRALLLTLGHHGGLVHLEAVVPGRGPRDVLAEAHHLLGPAGHVLVDGVVLGGRAGDQAVGVQVAPGELLLELDVPPEALGEALELRAVLAVALDDVRRGGGGVLHDALRRLTGDVVAVHSQLSPFVW